MKPMITTLLALSLLSVSQAFAARMEHSKKDIKLLNDSAAALASVDPDLSGRLTKYADKEAGEKAEAVKAESKMTMKDDAKLLKDAAAALKASRPDLSKGLDRYAAKESREHRRMSAEPKATAPETQPQNAQPTQTPAPPVTPGY